MLEIAGGLAAAPAPSRRRVTVELTATDRAALLVAWLNELLFLLESQAGCVEGLRVEEVGETRVRAVVGLTECERPEGQVLKAATYHQLAVTQGPDGYTSTVFFDV